MEKINPASFSATSELWLANIYQQDFVVLKMYAVRIMHDEIEADEILGQSFAILARELRDNPHEFASPVNARAFLKTVIKNKCLSWLRKKRLVKVGEPAELMADEHFLVLELEKRDLLLHLHSLFHRLPEKLQQVAILLFKEGLTSDEVAQQLNFSKQALLVYKSRILKKLQQMTMAGSLSGQIVQMTTPRVVKSNDGKLSTRTFGDLLETDRKRTPHRGGAKDLGRAL